jgi:hypothetical protein
MGVPQAEAHTLAARSAPANLTSTTQAGYVLASAPTPTSAADKFKVPTLTCPSTGTSGIALVAFLFTSSGLTGGEVTAECSSGTAVYAGVLAVNGGTSGVHFTPAAGDVMQAVVSESATATNASLVDITQSIGESHGSTAGATTSSVLVGMHSLPGSSGSKLHIPRFGTERFTAGAIDGGTVAASGAVAEDMQTRTHVLQIQTGALNSAGTGWNEVFKHR